MRSGCGSIEPRSRNEDEDDESDEDGRRETADYDEQVDRKDLICDRVGDAEVQEREGPVVGLHVIEDAAQTCYQDYNEPVEDVAEGEAFRDFEPGFEVEFVPDRHCIGRPRL